MESVTDSAITEAAEGGDSNIGDPQCSGLVASGVTGLGAIGIEEMRGGDGVED